jgi:plastocyanin
MRVARLLILGAVVAVMLLACRTSARPGDVRVEVSTGPGTELTFEPAHIVAPAQTHASLVFSNSSTLPHNLDFLGPVAARTRAIVQPGASDVIDFETPAAGTYRFVCTIHEDMVGTLETR